MLAPAFHYRVLDDFLPKINSDARSFLNYIEGLRQQHPEGEIDDIAEPVMLCALDNICRKFNGDFSKTITILIQLDHLQTL